MPLCTLTILNPPGLAVVHSLHVVTVVDEGFTKYFGVGTVSA
jgi:hypothetical protein